MQKLVSRTQGGISMFQANDWINRNGMVSLDHSLIESEIHN